MGGFRSAISFANSFYVNGGTFFTYSFSSYGTFTKTWYVDAQRHNSDALFNAGELIDAAAIGSGSGFNDLHTATGHFSRWVSSYYSSFGSSIFSSGSTSFNQSSGILAAGQRGFLALSWDLDDEAVFGWADISLSTDGLSLTVHGWAFEDSGVGILAGETGASNPLPGLGGLAALACGAAGMRRKRNRVA